MTKTRWIVLLLLTTGCGGVGGGRVPRDQYTAEAYKAICTLYTNCGIAKSVNTCNEYFQTLLGAYASVGATIYDKSIDLGKIKYDEAAASRCLSSYSSASCSLSALISPSSDCRSVYVGQVPVGSSCGFGQCIPSAYCSSEVDQKCPGTCKARVEAGGAATSPTECVVGLVIISGVCSQPTPEGSSCGTTVGIYNNCAPGLTCASDTKTCTKPRLEGAACSSTMPCDIFYACVGGKCTSPGDVGASCGSATSGSLSCKLELFCNASAATPTCAERLGEGSLCTGSECGFNLRCSKVSASATAKTCHKPTPINQPCTTAQGSDCDSGLFCSTNSLTCIAQLADGATCTTSDVCNLGSCTSGKCVSYLASICF